MFDHGETLRLQFPKEDLGYVYAAGAGGWCCVCVRVCVLESTGGVGGTRWPYSEVGRMLAGQAGSQAAEWERATLFLLPAGLAASAG